MCRERVPVKFPSSVPKGRGDGLPDARGEKWKMGSGWEEEVKKVGAS